MVIEVRFTVLEYRPHGSKLRDLLNTVRITVLVEIAEPYLCVFICLQEMLKPEPVLLNKS